MINIYSIKEVIEASNNILNRTKFKNKVVSIENSGSKQVEILKKDKPLILKDEVLNENHSKTNLNKSNIKEKIIKQSKQDKLIDKLYLRFNKKVKNTLKLIFELQKEVSNLNQLKDFLKVSNKKFKTQISKLNTELKKINILNKKKEDDRIILNKKVTELSKKLSLSKNEIEDLRKYKLQLESELKDKASLNGKINELSNNLKFSEDEIKSLKRNKIELEKEILNYKIQEEKSSKKIYDISEVEKQTNFSKKKI